MAELRNSALTIVRYLGHHEGMNCIALSIGRPGWLVEIFRHIARTVAIGWRGHFRPDVRGQSGYPESIPLPDLRKILVFNLPAIVLWRWPPAIS